MKNTIQYLLVSFSVVLFVSNAFATIIKDTNGNKVDTDDIEGGWNYITDLTQIKSIRSGADDTLSFSKGNFDLTDKSGITIIESVYGSTETIYNFGKVEEETIFNTNGVSWNDVGGLSPIPNDATLNFLGDVYMRTNARTTSLYETTGNVTGKVNLLVANGSVADGDSLTIIAKGGINDSNPLYDVAQDTNDSTKHYVSQKTTAGITEAGYNAAQASALKQMMNDTLGNGTYADITENAQLGFVDAVKTALIPFTTTQYTNLAELNVSKENANIAMGRLGMAGIAGGEEAETSINLIPWVQGMFNHTNNTQSDGFTANTKGIALGIDAEINNAWMVGIGYSNVNTRIKTDTSSTRGYGDNGFIYGQYKPADWYVRAMAGYGRTTYKDKTNDTKWDVDTYSLNAFAGYIWGMLDTSIGARYTYLDNKSYKSGDATISADDTDNLTAVVDFKVSQDYAAKDWMITPSAHVGFTYDVISADNASTVALGAGYGSYEVNGERLHKAGVEVGTGVVFKNGASEFHLNYEGAFREDNYSNGGFVKFKYNF